MSALRGVTPSPPPQFAPPRPVPPPPIEDDPNRGWSRALLHLVYDLAWLTVLTVASPWWIFRCVREPGYRRMTAARLGFHWPDLRRELPSRPRVLVHGVSVGEVKGARSLVERLRELRPDVEVVICTTTNTGEDVARGVYPDLRVVRLPVDISFLVARFLRRIDPACIILVELEIWPNLLRRANRDGRPVAVVNGRITPSSYRRYRHFRHYLPQFNRASLYCVQDQEYAERFDALIESSDRTVVTGNIKVDGLPTGIVEPSARVVRLLAPRPGQLVLVCGSTHAPEERQLVDSWRRSFPDARLVLVPRHPERSRDLARELEREAGVRTQRWTELDAPGAAPSDPALPCIVDVIGVLEQVYALADLVFVGGSLVPHGGQNMLEPASQGRAVVYGPSVTNFAQEAGLLEKAGAARRLDGPDELDSVVPELLGDAAARRRMGEAGRAAVEAQKGATARTLLALDERVLVAVPRARLET